MFRPLIKRDYQSIIKRKMYTYVYIYIYKFVNCTYV
jgi:hypothetical protein